MLWISVWKSKITFELMRLKWIVEPILSGPYIYRNSHIERDLRDHESLGPPGARQNLAAICAGRFAQKYSNTPTQLHCL